MLAGMFVSKPSSNLLSGNGKVQVFAKYRELKLGVLSSGGKRIVKMKTRQIHLKV